MKLYKSILPNSVTLLSLFCAFFSLISAIKNYYGISSILIFLSMILDGLDGRIARILKIQSDFGEQLDSIADMVSFGLAPAIIICVYQLQYFGIIGYLVSFVYCACAALRLALFNTLIGKIDKKWFIGIPSPTAAGLLMGIIWIVDYPFYIKNNFNIQLQFIEANIKNISLIITLFAAISMIIPIKFYSFKIINKKIIIPIIFVIILALLLSLNPPLILFLIFLMYSFSGYIYCFYQKCIDLFNKKK